MLLTMAKVRVKISGTPTQGSRIGLKRLLSDLRVRINRLVDLRDGYIILTETDEDADKLLKSSATGIRRQAHPCI